MSSVKDISGTLGAGARRKIPLRGSFFYLRAATAPLDVELQLVDLGDETGQGTLVTMKPGDKITPKREYDSVVLLNNNAVSVDYEVTGGDGDYDRPIPDIVNVSVSVPASDTINGTADVTISGTTNATADQILTSNPDRIRAIITALAGNDQNIRISGTDVDANIGIQLAPGESVAIDSTGEIWGCEEVAGTNAVSVIEYE